MVLIYNSLVTDEGEPLFICLPSVCLLWWRVNSDILIIFKMGCLFFYFWILDFFFIYSGYQSFVGYMICRYSLSVCVALSSPNSDFWRAHFLILIKSNISFFLYDYAFGVLCKKSLHYPKSQIFIFMYSFRSSIIWDFTFRPWSILSLSFFL